MMLLARTLWRAVLLSATMLLLPAPAWAQGYPVRPIKLVVPVELLKIEAEIDVVHVPYRGAAPAVNDLLGGHIDMIVLDVSVLLPHIRSGAIKGLAVTSATRSDALPDVPTTGEAGFKTVLSDNWYGLIAPAGLPAEVETRLRSAAISTLRSAELKKQYDTQDAVPSPSTPEEFAAFVKGERAKWEPVVSAVGIKLD
jgi:tripartite-type tricarboxylate transporter receptor subunit TctC